ncbi:MAG: EamA family transporter [Ignavibacteriaceae bacterium]
MLNLGNDLFSNKSRCRTHSHNVICRNPLIVAGSIFITILKFLGKSFPSKKDLLHIGIMGIALIGFGNGLVVVGEQYISSGLAALLITTVPFGLWVWKVFYQNDQKLIPKLLRGF